MEEWKGLSAGIKNGCLQGSVANAISGCFAADLYSFRYSKENTLRCKTDSYICIWALHLLAVSLSQKSIFSKLLCFREEHFFQKTHFIV